MKILLVTHFFPPGHPGGTEAYTYSLARALQRLGHSPTVVCAEGWGIGNERQPHHADDVFDGIPVRRVHWNWEKTPDPFVFAYDNPEVNRRFASYFDELRPDVIHATSCYAFGAGIIREASRAGVPSFMTLTDFWFMCPRHTLWRGDGQLCTGPSDALTCQRCMAAESPLYQSLSKILPADLVARGFLAASHQPRVPRLRGLRGYVGDADGRLAFLRGVFDLIDVPLAPSQFLRETFGRNGFPTDRMRLSPYGHDLSWRSRVRPRDPDGRPRLGYIGSIDRLKGVDVLAKAFQLLAADVPAELRIYGDAAKNPGFTEELWSIVQGNPNVKFMGPFERSEIAAVYSDLDVVVVPSVWFENTPIVVSEAFAAGKPVIATDLGSLPEMVHHGKNGLLFPRGDVSALAEALRSIISDSSLRKRLSEGIGPVRSIEDEAQSLSELYETSVCRAGA